MRVVTGILILFLNCVSLNAQDSTVISEQFYNNDNHWTLGKGKNYDCTISEGFYSIQPNLIEVRVDVNQFSAMRHCAHTNFVSCCCALAQLPYPSGCASNSTIYSSKACTLVYTHIDFSSSRVSLKA